MRTIVSEESNIKCRCTHEMKLIGSFEVVYENILDKVYWCSQCGRLVYVDGWSGKEDLYCPKDTKVVEADKTPWDPESWLDTAHWNEHCTECEKEINFIPAEGSGYCSQACEDKFTRRMGKWLKELEDKVKKESL